LSTNAYLLWLLGSIIIKRSLNINQGAKASIPFAIMPWHFADYNAVNVKINFLKLQISEVENHCPYFWFVLEFLYSKIYENVD